MWAFQTNRIGLTIFGKRNKYTGIKNNKARRVYNNFVDFATLSATYIVAVRAWQTRHFNFCHSKQYHRNGNPGLACCPSRFLWLILDYECLLIGMY